MISSSLLNQDPAYRSNWHCKFAIYFHLSWKNWCFLLRLPHGLLASGGLLKGWWVHLILAANYSNTMCVDVPLLLHQTYRERCWERGSSNLRKYPTDTIHIKWIQSVVRGNFKICEVGASPILFIKTEMSCLGVVIMELYLFMDSPSSDL